MSGILSNEIISPASNLYAYPSFLTDSAGKRKTFEEIESNRRIRHTKFPSLKGANGVYPFQGNTNSNTSFSGVENEDKLKAPHRAYDNLIDPTSGFVSAGGDIDRNTGHTRIESLAQLNKTPQSTTPQTQHMIQKNKLAASLELNCDGIWSPVAPTAWNSRKIQDIWIRSKLGGWTSDVDPRKASKFETQPQMSSVNRQSQSSRDKLANKYVYGTSTQRGYEDVPWDSILHPKRWPPTLAAEEKPDISLYHRIKCYKPAAQEYKVDGHNPDRPSPGYSSYKNGPVTFGYSGTENPAEDYTREEKLESNTKSSSAPGPRDAAHPVPVDKPASDYRRKSRMSKMVTLVPPHNPFNTVDKF